MRFFHHCLECVLKGRCGREKSEDRVYEDDDVVENGVSNNICAKRKGFSQRIKIFWFWKRLA